MVPCIGPFTDVMLHVVSVKETAGKKIAKQARSNIIKQKTYTERTLHALLAEIGLSN